MANQIKNHFQLEPDMPVKRYKQKNNPSNGMSERFFTNDSTDRTIAIIQKMIVAIFTADV